MKILATNKSEEDKALIDPWTAVHAGVGLAAGLLGLNFFWSMAGAAAYEVVEHHVQKNKLGHQIFGTHEPEVLGNAITDVGIFGIGWWLGDKWNKTGDTES